MMKAVAALMAPYAANVAEIMARRCQTNLTGKRLILNSG